MKKTLKIVDLFSGCGGFSFGFEKAGYHVVLGVDNDKVALETFRKNHKNSESLIADLHTDEAIEEIAFNTKNHKIDVIIAGPPCQGFSVTGPRNETDERNRLFYSVFRLADKIKPKAVIIENVPGLAGLYGGKAKNAIIEEFYRHDFIPNHKILFAPDYEVPQIRRRIFFVGLLKQLGKFEFPSPVLSANDYNNCSDAISDLPTRENDLGNEVDFYDKNPLTDYQKKMRNGNKILYNHVAAKHTELVVSVISQVPEGGNHKDLPPGVGESRRFNEAWTRYHSQKPSKTIETGNRNYFH